MLGRRAELQSGHLFPRHKTFPDLFVGHTEDVLHKGGLIGLQNAGFFGVFDEENQLIDGMNHLFAPNRFVSQEPKDQIGGAAHDQGQWSCQPSEADQRRHEPKSGPVGRLQSQVLGNQFAEDHVHERDDHKGDGRRRRMSGDQTPGAGKRFKPGLQQSRKGRFPQPAQTHAGKGHAQLRGRDGSIQVFNRGMQGLGAFLPLLDHFFHAGFAHRDQSELSGHEQAVERHQHRDANPKQR